MRRRPREGFSETTIVDLMHTFFNGAVLRHLVDPEAFVDAPRTVGKALLAMLEGLTEPDDLHIQPAPDLAAWVRHEAVSAALRLHRQGAPHGDGAVGLADVLAELRARAEERGDVEVDVAAVTETLANIFPTAADLWDAAVRDLLERRIGEVWQLRERSPETVLLKIAEDLLQLREQHLRLVAACSATRNPTRSCYLDELEGKLSQLLAEVGEGDVDPARTARLLLTDCLLGDRPHVEFILGRRPTPA
jgi:hypothetical protein